MYLSKDPSVLLRQRVEIAILRRTVNELLKAGYVLSVFDGEEQHKPTTNKKELFAALMETDDDYLFVLQNGKRIGWVRFIYGNDGWDVINDYTVNLESVLAPVNQYVEKLSSAPARS